ILSHLRPYTLRLFPYTTLFRSLDVEAVHAFGDGVGLRARAGAEAAAVELAEEAGAALAVGETEAGAGRVGRVARVRVDRGRRRRDREGTRVDSSLGWSASGGAC